MRRRRTTQIVLRPSATPEVSVLIPVHNHLATTLRCLAAVADDDSGVATEVLVLDDASSDATAHDLARMPGLRVVRSARNQGFLRNCNSGAGHARGRFLLFLNNDALLGPGALAALVRTMRSDPAIGIVGPRLLNADGTVQEAGGIIWSDATAKSYGRGWVRHDPRVQHRRDVDYVSGACMLVRRECWERAGGFDDRFAPAYYEDVDLAFTARALGYRVVYEPRAEVVHLEGVSHGTDMTLGVKRSQAVNAPTFAAKWRAELAHQPPPDPALAVWARDRRRRHVLVVDHQLPRPDQDAGSLRMTGIVRILAELGFAVHLLPDNGVRSEPYASDLDALGVEVMSGHTDANGAIRELGPSIDLAILSRPGPAARFVLTVRDAAPQATVLFDMVDVHSVRLRRGAATEGRPELLALARSTEEIELALTRACDGTIAVSHDERRHLRSLGVREPIVVLPTIHLDAAPRPVVDDRSGLVFVGGFDHAPNVDAVTHLVRDLLPLIHERIGEVPLTIAGSNAPPAVRALASPSVTVAGWVPDLGPIYSSTRVALAPVRYGAGVKGKVTGSVGAGLPTVTTTIGVEGTGLRHGRELLVADRPADFADHVAALYRDDELWRRLAAAGQDAAERRFGRAVTERRVLAILRAANVRMPVADPAVAPGGGAT